MRKKLCLLALLAFVVAVTGYGCLNLLPPPILIRGGSVKGVATSEKTGKPLAGIEVGDGETAPVTTDQSGRYSIPNIPAGETRTITANPGRAKGYNEVSVKITLGEGEERTLDFELLDVEPPKVALVNPPTGKIQAGVDVKVEATITDNEAVDRATLHYKAGGSDEAYAEAPMSPVGTNRYQGLIPKTAFGDAILKLSPNAGEVEFYLYVYAEDRSGNRTPEQDPPTDEEVLRFSMVDPTPPEIKYPAPVIVWPLNTPATIAPTVTDNVGVAEVDLFYQVSGEREYKSVGMLKGTGDTYYGVIPGEAVVEAGVKYYIRAGDGANAASWPDGAPDKSQPEFISPERLKSITIDPSSLAAIASGETNKFTATVRDDYNNSVSIAPLWSVSGNIGTIDKNGLFTAVKTGSGSVKATLWAISKDASVTVTPGSLSTIIVAPASAALTSGSTQQFGATGRDVNGNAISSITPTWSVIGGIGTVSPSGLFTATKAGIGGVIAASESISGTANVTVTSSPPVITSLTANPSAVNLGATSTITVAASDPDGDIQSYNWSASSGLLLTVRYPLQAEPQ